MKSIYERQFWINKQNLEQDIESIGRISVEKALREGFTLDTILKHVKLASPEVTRKAIKLFTLTDFEFYSPVIYMNGNLTLKS